MSEHTISHKQSRANTDANPKKRHCEQTLKKMEYIKPKRFKHQQSKTKTQASTYEGGQLKDDKEARRHKK